MKKVLLLLSLFSTMLSTAQKANGGLSFKKGQQLEVVTNVNIMSQSMMGPSSGTITMADNYAVNDVSGNAITLTKVPKHVKLNFTMGSQEIKLDSDNPKDMAGMFGEPVKEIMNQKPEFTIDAAGKVIAVKTDDKKKKQESAQAGMMGMMLPGMNLSAGIPQVGSPSFFQVLPSHEVSIGDSWTDSVNIEGNKNITTYKVKNITDKEIQLDFEGAGNTVSSQEAMGMKVNVTATTKGTGSIIIDKATGIIKQKTSTNNTETAMNIGGREMTSTMKSTMVTNVNAQ